MVFYWSFFAVFCLGHLSTCYIEKELPRKVSKIFIIPLLMLGLILSKTYNPLLYIGLILGWIGDIFLIFTGKKKFFIVGAISFALGHLSYIFATMILFFKKYSLSSVPFWIYIVLTIVAIVFILLTTFKIKKHMGLLSYLGAFYFYILVVALLTSYLTGKYILSIGFAVFMISDSILSIARFAHPIKRQHFYIMSTYIAAQTLICLSFIYG